MQFHGSDNIIIRSDEHEHHRLYKAPAEPARLALVLDDFGTTQNSARSLELMFDLIDACARIMLNSVLTLQRRLYIINIYCGEKSVI